MFVKKQVILFQAQETGRTVYLSYRKPRRNPTHKATFSSQKLCRITKIIRNFAVLKKQKSKFSISLPQFHD